MATDQTNKANWLMRGYELQNGETAEQVITDFFRPVFDELENQDEVETFHFNLNGDVLNLRVYPDGENLKNTLDELEKEHNRASMEGKWPNRDQDIERVSPENVDLIDRKREFGSKLAIEAAQAGLSDDHRQGLLERGIHVSSNNLGAYVDVHIPVGTDENGGLRWADFERY